MLAHNRRQRAREGPEARKKKICAWTALERRMPRLPCFLLWINIVLCYLLVDKFLGLILIWSKHATEPSGLVTCLGSRQANLGLLED